MAHDLFISYSSKDKNIADAVCSRMESGGIRCWYAPRDIEPGSDWADSIVEAINSSRIMVLIFTRNSNISKQVLREVDCAVSAGAAVIPLKLEDVEPEETMKYYLSAVHWLDAVDEKLEESIEELYKLCSAVMETSDAALAPSEPEKTEKRFPVKKVILVSLAAILLFFGSRWVLRTLRVTGVIHLRNFKPLGAESPIGELSAGYGTEPEYAEGTSPGNIHSGGYIAYSDGWYYFRSNDDEKLYRMREDGSESQKLSDHSAMYIFIHDSFVYFKEEHGSVGIFQISTDGEGEQMIWGTDVQYMSVIGDKLYYLDYYDGLSAIDLTQNPEDIPWSGESVYREEKFLEDLFEMCFDGEYIYYTTIKLNGIYRLSVATGEKEKIYKKEVSDIVLAGGYLYFNDLSDGSMKAIDTDSGKAVTVAPFLTHYYLIRNDGIYANTVGDSYLIRYDPSTGVTYELSNKPVTYVCLAHERLFYWDWNKFYSTDLNGKAVIAL